MSSGKRRLLKTHLLQMVVRTCCDFNVDGFFFLVSREDFDIEGV